MNDMDIDNKNLYEISKNIREAIFFNKKFDIPENYEIFIKDSEYNISKHIEIKSSKKNQASLIAFPRCYEMPNIHKNTSLIIKELAAKFYSIKPMEHGVYDVSIEKNKITLFKRIPYTSPAIDMSINEINFLVHFIKKYKKYSFPELKLNGDLNFYQTISCVNDYFSFYIPVSNHELLKGFETNYI